MKNLMYKIMLTCKQATFYSSVSSMVKIPFVRRMQLRMHFMACKACHDFDHHMKTIDKALVSSYMDEQLLSNEHLPEEKKAEIQSTLNQSLK